MCVKKKVNVGESGRRVRKETQARRRTVQWEGKRREGKGGVWVNITLHSRD